MKIIVSKLIRFLKIKKNSANFLVLDIDPRREYHFSATGGIDSEHNGREGRAAPKREFLSSAQSFIAGSAVLWDRLCCHCPDPVDSGRRTRVGVIEDILCIKAWGRLGWQELGVSV
jgi:hypothetical protein